MSRYQRVTWHHEFAEEPVTLLSEVADFGVEVRKIEIYRDGRADYADASTSTGSTILSETPLPSVEEIQDQPDFTVSLISQEEFEAAWSELTEGRA